MLIAALFVGIMIGMTVEQLYRKWKRADWQRRNAGQVVPIQGPKAPAPDPAPDAADQLRIVMNASFKTRPLLNRSESRLFGELNRIVADVAPEWRVLAQVNIGEFLASEADDAYRCINSKRVDLLLIDRECALSMRSNIRARRTTRAPPPPVMRRRRRRFAEPA